MIDHHYFLQTNHRIEITREIIPRFRYIDMKIYDLVRRRLMNKRMNVPVLIDR